MLTPTIHTPLQIGPHRLKNRLVALPVFTGYASPDGSVSALLLEHYTALGASGVALVVVANVAVSPDGVTSQYNLRIDDDRYIPGLKALAAAIRRQGALASIQLNHAGRFAKTEHPLLASPVDASNLTYHVASLKGFMHAFPFEKRFGLTHFFLKQIAGWRRAITEDEMHAVATRFYQAAQRAHKAGFDMVEVHGANGYLLCEFLSPATNKRLSGYGGSFENRTRFPLRVVGEIRRHLPPSVPLGYRLPLREWVPDGIELEEAIAFAQLLEHVGIGYLSAAAGNFNSIFFPSVVQKMKRRAYLREDMVQLTGRVAIPTIISGRVTTPALAADLLAQKAAHLVGLGRPLRVDPDWVRKADQPASAVTPCINCNWCLKRIILEQGFICRCWPRTRQLKVHLGRMLLDRNCNGLWVIADSDDLALFKASVPRLLPIDEPSGWNHAVTVLHAASRTGEKTPSGTACLAWAQGLRAAAGGSLDRVTVVEYRGNGTWDHAVQAELERQHHGMLLIGRNRTQPWRERLLYVLRHKVIGLIGANGNLGNVAVFLDFSDASLLALTFVHRVFMNRLNVRVTFIHANDGRTVGVERQWSRLKRLAGLNADEPLARIGSGEPIGSAIVKEAVSGRYGTIVMGKRGLTGIKRLLLGSVSRAVLRELDSQTLFLVD